MKGMYKFVTRVYNLLDKVSAKKSSKKLQVLLHKTIKGVEEDLLHLKYNTAISKLMILVNEIQEKGCGRDVFSKFTILLSPFASYASEELWKRLGNKFSVHQQKWPSYNKKLVIDQEIPIIIQINGKFRNTVNMPLGVVKKEALEKAKQDEKISKYLKGGYKKVIFVKNKVINFIV